MFLRRLPEALAEQQKPLAGISVLTANSVPAIPEFWGLLNKFLADLVKKIWHFMLEAKDLKQSRVLATKFADSAPAPKVFKIGALSVLKKAQRLFEQHYLDESEQAFIEVIKKNSHEFAAYEGLVKIYSAQKKISEVEQLLEYLVKHNPSNDSYLTQLGATLIRRRRFKEAIDCYTRALAINDLISVRYVNMALCYDALNLLNQARKNFEKALDLEPANVQYLMLLVDLVLKQGDQSSAKKLLEKGAEINPEDPQIIEKLINHGWLPK